MNSSTILYPQDRITCEKGFTIVEVMIAIAIFAIGFLAVASMQTNALTSTNSARRITEALTLAEDWSEHLRALPFYDEDLDLDGVDGVEDFDMHPDLTLGDHTAPTDASPYTARWTVSAGPLPNFSAGILDTANEVRRSLNIRVWVTPDNRPNDIQAEIIFGKFWSMDKRT